MSFVNDKVRRTDRKTGAASKALLVDDKALLKLAVICPRAPGTRT